MTRPPGGACLVCGSTDAPDARLDGLLCQCPACGFARTAAAGAATEDLYDDAYFTGGGYEDYFQPAARRFEASQRVAWVLSMARPATLLEVGSAGGFFVEQAIEAGIAAQGIEVSPGAARYAREELHVPVDQGDFATASFTTTFAAVCAFHVLEHVEDPHAFVDRAFHITAPGGLLVVEVPNFASVGAGRTGADWPALQPEFHRWHFSPGPLRRLVEDHGYEIVRQDTVVPRFYMPPRFRRRQARGRVLDDVRDLHSIRLTHPAKAELLRLVARRPGAVAA